MNAASVRRHMRMACVGALALGCVGVTAALAADHNEAPLTRADQPADIADLYAWHDNGASKLVAIVTFAGFAPPSVANAGTFDEDVLYTLNIDNDGDFLSDIDVLVQYFRDDKGRMGMRVENLPGAPESFDAPVNRPVNAGDCRVFSGLRDDPFFFDLDGFRQTLQTGTLSFDGTRDTFAGTNATVIVLEMDLDAARDSGSTLNLWATTARK